MLCKKEKCKRYFLRLKLSPTEIRLLFDIVIFLSLHHSLSSSIMDISDNNRILKSCRQQLYVMHPCFNMLAVASKSNNTFPHF